MADLQSLLPAAGLPLDGEKCAALQRYQDLLIEWNQRMDLTNVPPEEMAARHFLDSLLPLKRADLFPQNARVIDVGTGAGFPGLPLAIARPDLKVTLLEAQGKRCQFLSAVCGALSLENAAVVQDRAEVLGQNPSHREQYDRALARAVAPLNVLAEYLLPLVRVGGMALCWKGPAAEQEARDGAAAAQRLGGSLGDFWEMPLPGQDTRHVLCCLEKNEKTLPQYPRKNGIPAKRPLKSDK